MNLVERLRAMWVDPSRLRPDILSEAATRIEQLEAQNKALAAMLATQLDEHFHTWRAARAAVDGDPRTRALFEGLESTKDARAMLKAWEEGKDG